MKIVMLFRKNSGPYIPFPGDTTQLQSLLFKVRLTIREFILMQ